MYELCRAGPVDRRPRQAATRVRLGVVRLSVPAGSASCYGRCSTAPRTRPPRGGSEASLRTVRRTMSSLMGRLGARSSFEAGPRGAAGPT